MQFKIKNTKIKISFTFFAFILLAITIDTEHTYLLLILFALIHELIHLIFIKLLSVAPKKISLTLFGANIIRSITTTGSYNSEILINLSAPISNLVFGLIFYLIYNYVTNDPIIRKNAEINLTLGVFNLIPFYNFDGGNALRNILLKYLNNEFSEKIMTIISIIITVIFSFVSMHIFFNCNSNFSLILVSIYMIFTLAFKGQNT